MTESLCVLCNSNNLILLDSPSSPDDMQIFVCENCFSVKKTSNVSGNVGGFEKESASKEVSYEVEKFGLNNASLVMHIGSGDGSLLKLFKAKSIPCFGFESDQDLAHRALERNVKTVADRFSVEHAWDLLSEANTITDGQKIDFVIASNILSEENDLSEILEAVRLVLKDDGVILFEENWITAFDFESSGDAESVTYISSLALSNELLKHDLEIVEVQENFDSSTLKWFVKPKGLFSVSPIVTEYVGREEMFNLHSLQGVVEYCQG